MLYIPSVTTRTLRTRVSSLNVLNKPSTSTFRKRFSWCILRVYTSRRQQTEKPPQSIGIAWYRDMLRALVPLHELEIAHANVRIDDFLCHSEGAIVLYDFTCSRLFGQDNPSATGSPESLGVTGPPQTVSDPTDRFALASVMFEVETGAKGDLTHAISPQNSQPWKAVTRALIW